jgi:hypothetical protein
VLAGVATYAPVAFLIGWALGLASASRWRVVRRADYERWEARRDQGDD